MITASWSGLVVCSVGQTQWCRCTDAAAIAAGTYNHKQLTGANLSEKITVSKSVQLQVVCARLNGSHDIFSFRLKDTIDGTSITAN